MNIDDKNKSIDANEKQVINNFNDFWPFYLSQHENRVCKILHFVGTTLAFIIVLCAIFLQQANLIIYALISGYSFAWIGHFVFEKNRPATFKYPLLSLRADFKLWFCMLLGRYWK